MTTNQNVLRYDDLTKLGYLFRKEGKLYHVFAPNEKALGIWSEKKEALDSARIHVRANG